MNIFLYLLNTIDKNLVCLKRVLVCFFLSSDLMLNLNHKTFETIIIMYIKQPVAAVMLSCSLNKITRNPSLKYIFD